MREIKVSSGTFSFDVKAQRSFLFLRRQVDGSLGKFLPNLF